MSDCSYPHKAMKALYFSLARPRVPSSLPNPWSSLISPKAAEAQVEKEESGPQVRQTIPFSCLPPLLVTTDRRL